MRERERAHGNFLPDKIGIKYPESLLIIFTVERMVKTLEPIGFVPLLVCKNQASLSSLPGFFISPSSQQSLSSALLSVWKIQPTWVITEQWNVGQFQEQSKLVEVSRNDVTSHWYFCIKLKYFVSWRCYAWSGLGLEFQTRPPLVFSAAHLSAGTRNNLLDTWSYVKWSS